MSAGRPERPHIVRQWVPRQGRFVYRALPIVLTGWARELTNAQRKLNMDARRWCEEQNAKDTA